MNNVNVLIIEDIPEESNVLAKMLTDNNYNIAGIARTHNEALTLFYGNNIDIVIIDIFLAGHPDGIAFAESINIIPGAAKPFVFLTNSHDRKIFERAKLTHPFSFLMKPFNELEILYAIEMAVEKFYSQKNIFSVEHDTVVGHEYLYIKKKKSLKKVFIHDILYIEVEGKYCNVISENENFLILLSLSKVCELLQKDNFIRTHRNYLVNADKILEITPDDNYILLKGNHKVTLSDNYKKFINNYKVLK
ncbi:MAG TPA: response regulator transcription factor [Flavobacterium sp.]|nr:response regulator transcription factor [Flavobacterium sp.]